MPVRRQVAALVAGLAMVVTGCASSGSAGGSGAAPTGSGSSGSGLPPGGDPMQLVGLWRLDAPGQAKGSILRLGDDLSLWSDCGYLMGQWDADSEGLFVGHVDGGSQACMPKAPGDPTPDWLAKVTAFRADASGAQLLDPAGAVVARLMPGGHPTAGPDVAAALASPPAVTDELRARFGPAPSLPAGLTAATPDRLLGRWGAADTPQLRGFVELAADGSWTGSDGANAQHGRWAADSSGNLVAVSGAQTLIGCMPNSCVDAGNWFVTASRAAFDGTTLVLIDTAGKVTGRLAHAVAPTPVPPVSPPPAGSGS